MDVTVMERPATAIKAEVGMPVVVIQTDGETYQGRIVSLTEHGAFIETDHGQVRGETWLHIFGILRADERIGPRSELSNGSFMGQMVPARH